MGPFVLCKYYADLESYENPYLKTYIKELWLPQEVRIQVFQAKTQIQCLFINKLYIFYNNFVPSTSWIPCLVLKAKFNSTKSILERLSKHFHIPDTAHF